MCLLNILILPYIRINIYWKKEHVKYGFLLHNLIYRNTCRGWKTRIGLCIFWVDNEKKKNKYSCGVPPPIPPLPPWERSRKRKSLYIYIVYILYLYRCSTIIFFSFFGICEDVSLHMWRNINKYLFMYMCAYTYIFYIRHQKKL